MSFKLLFIIIFPVFVTCSCGGPAIVLPNEKAKLDTAAHPHKNEEQPAGPNRQSLAPAPESQAQLPPDEDKPVLAQEVKEEPPEEPSPQIPQEAISSFLEAKELFRSGRYDESQAAAGKAIELSNDFVDAYILLAKILLQKSIGGQDRVQLKAAHQMVQMALKTEPDNIEARQLLDLLTEETNQ